MSFRELKLGKEGKLAPVTASTPTLRARRRVGESKLTKPSSTTQGLLYSRLRLVPSASCEASTDSSDNQSVSDHNSSTTGSHSSPVPPQSNTTSRQSPNAPIPTKSRGIPGFATSRYPTSRHNMDAPNMRGWSHRYQGDVVHSTGASPIMTSTSKTPKVGSRQSDDVVHEVAHFKKLVAQIGNSESILHSPEQQWRRRIMIRSAQESNRDIAEKLNSFHGTNHFSNELCKDYQHASALLSQQLELVQQEEENLTTEVNDDAEFSLQQEQEDYFVRVSREREQEIQNINHKMHQVGKIYNDLAAIIYDQQDQIDRVAENVHTARDNADGGLKHIENARNGRCLLDTSFEAPQCGGGLGAVEEGSRPEQKRKTIDRNGGKDASSNENVSSWYKPFQSLQRDIFGLGNDLASLSCSISENLECGSGN